MHPWRARLHRWFAPVARRSPLSPNAISLIALLLNAGAATLLYYGARKPILFLVAIVVITIAGLADAFDGIVAREQQNETRYGHALALLAFALLGIVQRLKMASRLGKS